VEGEEWKGWGDVEERKEKKKLGGSESIYTQHLPVPIGKYLYFCQH
jgi:hypothetical protein